MENKENKNNAGLVRGIFIFILIFIVIYLISLIFIDFTNFLFTHSPQNVAG